MVFEDIIFEKYGFKWPIIKLLLMNRNEKMILKKILENHLTVDHKYLTIEKLSKETALSEDELYKIISKLLVFQYVKMIKTQSYWTVNPFTITEKGLLALQFPWGRIVRDIVIGIAVITSFVAILIQIE